jgi:hypothetical protein
MHGKLPIRLIALKWGQRMERISSRLFARVLLLGLISVTFLPGLAVAEGALAIGLPNDVVSVGFAFGYQTNSPTVYEARQKALAACHGAAHAAPGAQALCTIVGSFNNQCVAAAEDPANGTPGVGWAVADDKDTAKQDALTMCQMKSPPARQAACKVIDSACDGSAK